jgi:hypothetical protein
MDMTANNPSQRWSVEHIDPAVSQAFDDFMLHDTSVRREVRGLLWDVASGYFSEAVVLDCGLVTAQHGEALRKALKQYLFGGLAMFNLNEMVQTVQYRIRDLDYIYGDGEKVTAFVRRFAPEYQDLRFDPVDREQESAKEKQQ